MGLNEIVSWILCRNYCTSCTNAVAEFGVTKIDGVER